MVLDKPWVGALRILARGVGFSASVFFLFFTVGEGMGEFSRGHYAVLPLLVSLLITTVGLILAFWREHLGSLVTLTGCLLMAIMVGIMARSDVWMLEFLFAGPFAFAGLLLFWCSQETRRTA